MRRGRTTRSVWIIHVTHPRDDPKKDVHFCLHALSTSLHRSSQATYKTSKASDPESSECDCNQPPHPAPGPVSSFSGLTHLPPPAACPQLLDSRHAWPPQPQTHACGPRTPSRLPASRPGAAAGYPATDWP